MMRKGQVKRLEGRDMVGKVKFVAGLRGSNIAFGRPPAFPLSLTPADEAVASGRAFEGKFPYEIVVTSPGVAGGVRR
jgi:hypothetical protein